MDHMAGLTGLEPVHARVKVLCLTDLATAQYLAHLGGLEPPTHGLEVRCSIQLSYRCIMERVKGIEPSQPAWKAGALPLSYTRMFSLNRFTDLADLISISYNLLIVNIFLRFLFIF